MRASALRVAYGTSKAVLMHLTKQQALELGAKGIGIELKDLRRDS
jgi:meso-butanediol dehydrogenase/(S,S)-butanediol dehydrogenase/diacetyl reductase